MSQLHYARIADIYDSFVSTDYDVEFFINEAKKANGPILELMAGTGRLTIPLAQAGIEVTCVDFSAEMLAVLNTKLVQSALNVDIHHMDVRELCLNRQFPQIIIPFQAFPELTEEGDQRRALQRIREHLTDDGLFICTLHNPTVRRRSIDGQMHLAGRFARDDGQLFVWLLQTHGADVDCIEVLEFFEEYDSDGVLRSKRYSQLQFHLLEKVQFEHLLESVGFKVVNLYGDYFYAPFDPETSPFMIWMLQRV